MVICCGRLTTSNGLLLHPSRPSTATDVQMLQVGILVLLRRPCIIVFVVLRFGYAALWLSCHIRARIEFNDNSDGLFVTLCDLQAAFGGDVGPKGQVWTTESVISGWLFGIIFAVELAEPYTLKAEDTGWDRIEVYYCFTVLSLFVSVHGSDGSIIFSIVAKFVSLFLCQHDNS